MRSVILFSLSPKVLFRHGRTQLYMSLQILIYLGTSTLVAAHEGRIKSEIAMIRVFLDPKYCGSETMIKYARKDMLAKICYNIILGLQKDFLQKYIDFYKIPALFLKLLHSKGVLNI